MFYLFLQMFNCLFRPERCVAASTQEDLKSNLKFGEAWHNTYDSVEEVPCEKIEEIRQRERKRVKILRISIFQSFLISAILLVIALLINRIINPNWRFALFGPRIEIVSAFMLAWATFGQLGWEIRSYKGETLPERLNRFWFRSVFGMGMVLLFATILVSQSRKM